MSNKNVLITGASTGFGKLTAQALAKKGHMVISTMRDTKGKNAQYAQNLEQWAKDHNFKLCVLELDVTSDDSVNSAKEKALQLTNGKIDVVINNAGVFGGGLAESFAMADYKHLYEVNVFGSVRVTNAFLPILRRQGSGLIVQVSSVLGRVIIPFGGVYDSTKFALEAISESLYYELRPLGVDVSIVQPGPFATELVNKIYQPSNQSVTAEYGVSAQLMGEYFDNYGKLMNDPDFPNKPKDVADAILNLVETPQGKRPLRVVVDKMMGETAEALNEASSKVQAAVLQNFGLSQLNINN